MNSIATISARLLDHLFKRSSDPTFGSEPCVLDALTAIALIEARYAGATALGGSSPCSIADHVFTTQVDTHDFDEFGEAYSTIHAPNPRSAMASAMGMSMAGRRATVFLSGPDLINCQDLVARCVQQHLPIIIHVALRQASMTPSHDAYHIAANTGCMQFLATNVQDAVDVTMIARQVAEASLTPAIIATDAQTTAIGAQTVCLPVFELAEKWLGCPSDDVKSPSEAQRIIFGASRRRVPKRWDLERPLLLSPTHGNHSRALSDAARVGYFDNELPAILATAIGSWKELTGRLIGNVSVTDTKGQQIICIAQGSLVEVATAAAKSLNLKTSDGALGIEVLGIRCLRPFPKEEIIAAVGSATQVIVLETSTPQLCGSGPLTTEVTAALSNSNCIVTSVACHGATGNDIASLLSLALRGDTLPSFLGISFVSKANEYPKRAAAMDELQRAYPQVNSLAHCGDQTVDLRPEGSFAIAVHRLAGEVHETFANELAYMIHAIAGGSIRTHLATTLQRVDEPCVDYVTHFEGVGLEYGTPSIVDLAITPIHNPLLQRRLRGEHIIAPSVSEQAKSWEATESTLAIALHAFQQARGGAQIGNATIVEMRREHLLNLGCDDIQRRITVFEESLESEPVEMKTGEAIAVTSPSPLLESNKWDDPVGSLPRFWDQTGVLYKDGNVRMTTADPFHGIDAIPPLTASMRDVSGASRVLPIFDPAHCDGNPILWTTCPDGSVSALVISAKRLIESGISMAGGNAASLRSIIGGLAKQMNAIAKSNMQTQLSDLLLLAFDAVNPAKDRREALQEGLDAVISAIGTIPIAKTPIFFDLPEQQQQGTGEFLILTVDPDACKSPELIIATAADHGIEATKRTHEAVARARALRQLVHQLPDTSGETIQRVSQLDGMRLPAILLSRHCHHAMAAGDAAEAGSGAKLAVRQALALTEYQLQPRLQELLGQVNTLNTQLQASAKKLLADAIPIGNLDAISDAIATSGQDEVDLASILSSISSEQETYKLDGETLRLMSALSLDLEDLSRRLLESAGGLGRARSGVTISGSTTASWASVFPWNPFSCPTAIDMSDTGCSLAAGLFEGQLDQFLADLNVIRRAKLVLENPIKAAHPDERVEALSLEELSKAERALCPPMIVVADAKSLQGSALSEVVWLLNSDVPIKIIVLSDGTQDIAMVGLTTCNAFVAQCSPAYMDHYAKSVTGALEFNGPALISVYAASPESHGFAIADLLKQSALAVETRVCPLFTFDPSKDGVFGTCLDISANPDVTSTVVKRDGVERTPTMWADSQLRFTRKYDDEQLVLARWKMLQELSGVVTPFDAIARAKAVDAAEAHQQALDELAKQYEERISQLREQYHAEALASVTSGLMMMASQAQAGDGS